MKTRHLELDGCIVNIREGLTDHRGRKVTSIEIIPDDHYNAVARSAVRGGG